MASAQQPLGFRAAAVAATTAVLTFFCAATNAEPGDTPKPGEVREFAGMAFVWIPPGTFDMGSRLSPQAVQRTYGTDLTKTEFWEDEHPQHAVTITKGYWLGKHEVTNGEFRRYKSDHDSGAFEGENLNEDGQPAVHVSWLDAQEYMRWLNANDDGEGIFRLPTEAEWEYACRGGTTGVVPWGDLDGTTGQNANIADQTAKSTWPDWAYITPTNDNHAVAAPVGQFKPNPFGVHDIIGNVWEWCADRFAPYTSEAQTDPVGPDTGGYRVVRGGSWRYAAVGCRAAYRDRQAPDTRNDAIGFRLVRSQD